jgi:transcriptional regulator with XRE-family HTH domain
MSAHGQQQPIPDIKVIGAQTTPCLGTVIKARRQELGWTQEKLAERMASVGDETFRQSDVSRLERGKVELPHLQRLACLAAVLDMPLGELLARSGWAAHGPAHSPDNPRPRVQDAPRDFASTPTAPFTPTPPVQASRPETLPPALSEWSKVRELIAEATATQRRTREIIANSEALRRLVGTPPRAKSHPAPFKRGVV